MITAIISQGLLKTGDEGKRHALKPDVFFTLQHCLALTFREGYLYLQAMSFTELKDDKDIHVY